MYYTYNNDKNWGDKESTRQFLNAGKPVIINHYNETNCDKVYIDYMDYYDKSISYICEDANLKKYVHYNEWLKIKFDKFVCRFDFYIPINKYNKIHTCFQFS